MKLGWSGRVTGALLGCLIVALLAGWALTDLWHTHTDNVERRRQQTERRLDAIGESILALDWAALAITPGDESSYQCAGPEESIVEIPFRSTVAIAEQLPLVISELRSAGFEDVPYIESDPTYFEFTRNQGRWDTKLVLSPTGPNTFEVDGSFTTPDRHPHRPRLRHPRVCPPAPYSD